jgi:hypothetical protein
LPPELSVFVTETVLGKERNYGIRPAECERHNDVSIK